MLSGDAKRLYGMLKKKGVEAITKLKPEDRDMIINGNKRLFQVERQRANPMNDYVIETAMVIDRSILTDQFIYDTLKEHGVI
ncbi:MAG: hypothetical protein PF690_05425 [Deltaproteobacteria bacterium]|jgi:hypothetical protein|nr:hypothetical protein [Deltaproteobacteria bacterium]